MENITITNRTCSAYCFYRSLALIFASETSNNTYKNKQQPIRQVLLLLLQQ